MSSIKYVYLIGMISKTSQICVWQDKSENFASLRNIIDSRDFYFQNFTYLISVFHVVVHYAMCFTILFTYHCIFLRKFGCIKCEKTVRKNKLYFYEFHRISLHNVSEFHLPLH